jgi:sugar phosphate permease
LLWLVPWRLAVRPLLAAGPAAREVPLPPLLLLRTPAMWVMMATHFAANFGFYFILSWLPLYLVQSRGYSILEMTELATTLYGVQAASALLVGWWSDHLVAGGRGEGAVRRAMLAAGFLVNAAAIVGIGTSSSSFALVLWLLLAGATHGLGVVNLYAVGQIFAGPRAAGSWIGIQNGFGNVAGIVGPVITGIIIDSTGSYLNAFYLTAAVVAAGGLLWYHFLPAIERVCPD